MFIILVLKASKPYVYCGMSHYKPQLSEKISDSVFFKDLDVASSVCGDIQLLDSSVLRAVPLNVHALGHLVVDGFRHFLEEHEK